jgi:hypothetical protein
LMLCCHHFPCCEVQDLFPLLLGVSGCPMRQDLCKDSEISAMPPLTGTQSIGIDRPTLAVTDRVHWDLFCQHGRAIRPDLD